MVKQYGIKLTCYGEHLGEPLETWCEHIENRKKKKKENPMSPPLTENQKEEKIPLECMLNFLIGYMKILFLKLNVTIFNMG